MNTVWNTYFPRHVNEWLGLSAPDLNWDVNLADHRHTYSRPSLARTAGRSLLCIVKEGPACPCKRYSWNRCYILIY